MIRGTTPKHTFHLPICTENIESVRVTYAQNGAVVLVKNTADCEVGDMTVSVKLTQEDTLNFDANKTVKIQLRVLTKSGDALSTLPYEVPAYECLDGEVLV